MKNCNPVLVLSVLCVVTISHAQSQCSQTKKYGGTSYCRSSTISAALIQADVVIDSIREAYSNLRGYTRYKWISVINKKALDTTVYSVDSNLFFPSIPVLDTQGVVSQYVDSSYIQWNVSKGDTLRNVFVFQENCPNDSPTLTIVDGQCYFLTTNYTSSMGIDEALRLFNDYAVSKSIYRGYNPPSAMRLGPIASNVPGDQGWELRAYNDTNFWYLILQTGTGDCPAGCTGRFVTTYTIGLDGVKVLSTSCSGEGCWGSTKPAGVSSKHPDHSIERHEFDISGRKIQQQGNAKQLIVSKVQHKLAVPRVNR